MKFGVGLARVTALALLACCSTDPSTSTQARTPNCGPRPGDWSCAVGTAALSPDFDYGSVGGQLEIGWRAASDYAITARHVGDYLDNGHDTSFNLTRVGIDWHPWRRRFDPFGGVSLGAAYGESVNESGVTGAHLGFQYWHQPRGFLQVLLGYDRFWTRTGDPTEVYRDGTFTFALSLGLLF